MTPKKLSLLLLTLIFALGVFLRFFRLSQTPPSLYWDEVAIGYNAYSILQTGRDEYGTPFPFWFRSYNDYKLPLYIYFSTLPIYLLGLTPFAIRFTSALAGSLSVLAVYFLAQQLQPTRRSSATSLFPLLGAFFFAISPWSLQFSRAAFEANLALFFTLAGFGLFLRSLRHSAKLLPLSVLLFIAATFTYHSPRVFLPLMAFPLIFLYRRSLLAHPKPLLLSLLLAISLLLPTLPSQFGPQGTIRALSTSYLTDTTPRQAINRLVANYLDNFDTNYLFFAGDPIGRHSVRTLGMLYYFDLPFILLGFLTLSRLPTKSKLFLTTWLLLAPLPASLATPSPHALRSQIILPVWILISALGATTLIQKINQKTSSLSTKTLIFASLGLFLSYNLAIYLFEYYLIYPRLTAPDWTYGARQVVELIASQKDQVNHIYLTDQVPPVYLATFLPIPPAEFQTLPHSPNSESPPTLGNITYFSKAWDITPPSNATSLIISPWWQKPPASATHSGTINNSNGDILYNFWYHYAQL